MKNYTNTIKTQRSQNVIGKQINQVIGKYYNALSRKESYNEIMDANNYRIKDKFYRVVVKCGHVGENWYTLVSFAVKASSGSEAAEKGKRIPRAKHDHRDVIREVEEISEEEYNALYEENDNNPYLKVKCIQDQRRADLTGLKVYREEKKPIMEEEKYWDKQYERKDKVKYLQKKQNLKRKSLMSDFGY